MTTATTARITGISDVTYDLMAILTNKLHCADALAHFRADAQAAGDEDVLGVYGLVEEHVWEDITVLRDLLRSRI